MQSVQRAIRKFNASALSCASALKFSLPSAIRSKMEHDSGFYALAYELYRNGQYETAAHFFRYLSISFPNERRYFMALAACYQMLKEYKLAVEYYGIAAIQRPNDPYAHWHAAECFCSLNMLKEAREALQSAQMTAEKSEESSLLSRISLMQQQLSD